MVKTTYMELVHKHWGSELPTWDNLGFLAKACPIWLGSLSRTSNQHRQGSYILDSNMFLHVYLQNSSKKLLKVIYHIINKLWTHKTHVKVLFILVHFEGISVSCLVSAAPHMGIITFMKLGFLKIFVVSWNGKP